MKILVLSDSHSALRFMRRCIDFVRPDHVVHLGDHYDDGKAMAEEYPHIRFHQVPGNCDRYIVEPWMADILCYSIGGVMFYMTHGHRHGVKSDTSLLLVAARESGAQAVLFGHTHISCCDCQEDGLWVLNPGSCRGSDGSAGIIEIEDEKISSCRILRQEDIEQA